MCCDSTLAVDYVHVLSASSDLMKFCLHEAFTEIFTKTFIENFMESRENMIESTKIVTQWAIKTVWNDEYLSRNR